MNGGTVQLTARPGNGNDTFNALADGLLATGDTLDGLGGIDTLNSRHSIAAGADKVISPATKNIEIHTVRADFATGAASTLTYDMSDVTGATEVWSNRSVYAGTTADGVLTFSGSGMTTAVALGIQGGDTGADNSSVDVTAIYQNVTGSADSSTLKLNGAAANVVTIAGIETLNIVTSKTETSASSTGASKLNSLVAANATTINISGDGKVTLSATDFDDTTGYKVDASTATGAVIATLEASAKQTFIGGSANDEVLVTTSVEATDSFDGGAGTADVFGHTEGTDVAAKVTNIKNFEVLDVTGSKAQTYDLSFYDGSAIDTVRITGAVTTSVVVNKMIEGGTLLLTGATGAATVDVNHKSISDPGFTGGTLNIKYAADANVNNTTTLTVGGASTVNIAAGAATAGTAKGTGSY